jgi:hypothetical protein
MRHRIYEMEYSVSRTKKNNCIRTINQVIVGSRMKKKSNVRSWRNISFNAPTNESNDKADGTFFDTSRDVDLPAASWRR